MVPVIFAPPMKDMATKLKELLLVTEETDEAIYGRRDPVSVGFMQIAQIYGSIVSPNELWKR